jgi:solute:Na+ symporter, SSS family
LPLETALEFVRKGRLDMDYSFIGEISLSPAGQKWLIVALVGYFLALLGVSIYASKNVKTEQDFLVAGRRLPLHLSWGALMATWFGSSAIMGATRNSFESGVSGTILDPFACSATLLFTGFVFAAPLWRMQLFTMADFYQQKYGPRAEFIACLIQVPTFFCWIGAQYKSLSALGATYFGFEPLPVILFSACVILSYTLVGGMWSVTLTDAIQILIAVIGLVVLGYATASTIGAGNAATGVKTVLANAGTERLSFFTSPHPYAIMVAVGTFMTGLLGNVPGQDLQQRIFSSDSEKTAKLSCILSGILYFVFGLIPVFLGLAAYQNLQGKISTEDIENERILPIMAGEYLGEAMVIVFVIAVIAIVVSVATSASISQAAILATNVLGRWQTGDKEHLSLDRFCILIVTAGSVMVALTGESIMGLLDIQLSLAMCALFVPLAMGVFGKPLGQLSGVLPMIVGFSVWSMRECFQRFVIPLSKLEQLKTDDPQQYADVMYPAFVQTEWGGGFLGNMGSIYAMIPADIQGLLAAIGAYFAAQAMIRAGWGKRKEFIAEDI